MIFEKRPLQWKRKFAWLPVEIQPDGHLVWLQYIERLDCISSFDYGAYYHYRLPGSDYDPRTEP